MKSKASVTMELTLFHGTDGANAASILEHGLRSSTHGRLGAGVYCTDDEEVAKKIARCRGLMFIVKCTVNVGKVADFGDGPTDGTWRDKGFDSATAAHPPWAGVTHNFTEICIADSSRVKVVGVEGMVSPSGPFAAGPHFIINAGCQKFLDSNDGDAVALWGDGIDIGDYPDTSAGSCARSQARPTHITSDRSELRNARKRVTHELLRRTFATREHLPTVPLQ